LALSRSENMARILGKDTKPENLLRKELWGRGCKGYRKNYRIQRLRPDIVFVGKKIAIFVDGCFWHGCPDHYNRPRPCRPDGEKYWSDKLRENVIRDIKQTLYLHENGWTVLRFWEHQIEDSLNFVADAVVSVLEGANENYLNRQRVIHVTQVKPGLEEWILVDLLGQKEDVKEYRKRSEKVTNQVVE